MTRANIRIVVRKEGAARKGTAAFDRITVEIDRATHACLRSKTKEERGHDRIDNRASA